MARLAQSVAGALTQRGIGVDERVAIVLPNGPEMATAFLTVASVCCAAPLNPAYKAEEFEFDLSDLNPAAVILSPDSPQAAAEVEARLGILVLGLYADEGAPAGLFRLDGAAAEGASRQARAAKPDDPALVLHTSGTTARLKIVPLSNAIVAASAQHIARSLELSPADTCLNIMPLFHIHALIAAVSASILAGAAICCTPGFSAFKFAEWLGDVRPTWYAAVPTMHHANMAFNPISALTTATLDVIIGDPGSRAGARAVMLEGQALAEALGVRFKIDVDRRIEGAAEVVRHKASMLQDLEMGRPLEIEAFWARSSRWPAGSMCRHRLLAPC